MSPLSIGLMLFPSVMVVLVLRSGVVFPPQSSILNLNEDTLWTGTPGNYTDPNSPEVLSEVRKLLDDGQYAEATTAALKLSGNPSEICCFVVSLHTNSLEMSR